MTKKRPTIKDVANMAEVSATTVSHVLNETRFVSEEVKEKVYSAVKALKYKPNHIARSLRGGGTKTIGVIIADIREEFFSEIVKSIEKFCNKDGFVVFLCDSEDQIEKELEYFHSLMSKDVDAIIISPISTSFIDSSITESSIPIIQIDRFSEDLGSGFIGIHNKKTAYDATNHLIKSGSKNILYIGYDDNVYTQKLRREGFLQAIEDNTLDISYHILSLEYMSNTELCDMLSFTIEDFKDIDTVFCSTGKLCYNFYRAALSKGMLEDGSLKILTYDNSKWFDLLKYPISSIQQPTEKIGKLAAQKVIDSINSKEDSDAKTQVLLNTDFIIRT